MAPSTIKTEAVKTKDESAQVKDVDKKEESSAHPNPFSPKVQPSSSSLKISKEDFEDAKSECASELSISDCSICQSCSTVFVNNQDQDGANSIPSLFSTAPFVLKGSAKSFKCASLNLMVSVVNFGKATLSLVMAILILILITPMVALFSLIKSHREKLQAEREMSQMERGEGFGNEVKEDDKGEIDGPYVIKIRMNMEPLVKASHYVFVISKEAMVKGGNKAYRSIRGEPQGEISLQDDEVDGQVQVGCSSHHTATSATVVKDKEATPSQATKTEGTNV